MNLLCHFLQLILVTSRCAINHKLSHAPKKNDSFVLLPAIILAQSLGVGAQFIYKDARAFPQELRELSLDESMLPLCHWVHRGKLHLSSIKFVKPRHCSFHQDSLVLKLLSFYSRTQTNAGIFKSLVLSTKQSFGKDYCTVDEVVCRWSHTFGPLETQNFQFLQMTI